MDQTRPDETRVDVKETIRWVVRICKKGRWLIALTAVLTVTGGNVGLSHVPNKYRSEATILVAEQHLSPSIETPLLTEPLADRVQIAAREVLSHSRLLEMVQQFGLAPGESADAAVETLQKNVEIEPAPPYAFRISFSAKTPQLAQSMTQKLVDLFIKKHLELENNEFQTAASILQQQLAERRKRQSELDQRMRDFKGHNGGQLPDEHQENLERWRQASYQLEALTASRDRANEHRVLLESTLAANLNVLLTRLKQERASLLKGFTPKHPEVMSKDQQIAQIEAEIEAIKSGGRTLQGPQDLAVLGDPSIAPVQAQLEANAVELDSLSKEAARQTAQVKEYEERLKSNPLYEQQLGAMQREMDRTQAEIADLEGRQQQSGSAADMQRRQEQQEFRLLDPPNLPTHPSSRRRQLGSLATVAAGPLLGIALAFLLDLRRPTFVNENELRRTLAAPLVLSIPEFPTPRERRARAWRIGCELLAGCIVAMVIAATEFYAYKLLA